MSTPAPTFTFSIWALSEAIGGFMLFRRITKGHTCPVCKGADAYRIKRAGLPVKIACKLLNLRPHWCPDCDTFFLGPRRPKEMHGAYQAPHSPKANSNAAHAGSAS